MTWRERTLIAPISSYECELATNTGRSRYWPPTVHASLVLIRQAPTTVQNTIQPTMTSDAAKVDSGISVRPPGPPPPGPPPNGVGNPPGSI